MTAHELAIKLLELPDVEVRMTIKRKSYYRTIPVTKLHLFSIPSERDYDKIYLHEKDITLALKDGIMWEDK